MDISFFRLYLYTNVRQLLYVDDFLCFCSGDNGPMNKNPIKIHRGVDNKIVFRTLGPDRTVVDISCGNIVHVRLIDAETSTVALEKQCILGPAKGIITAHIDSGDIEKIHAGKYTMVVIKSQEFVTGVPGEHIHTPIFSDMYDNVSFDVDITDQVFSTILPSVTVLPSGWVHDMLPNTAGQVRPCFVSSAIAGARLSNHIDGIHSFSVQAENYTGTVEVWGTLEESPTGKLDTARWFKIYPDSMTTDITFDHYTGTRGWWFKSNVMWVRFRYTPSTDVLDAGKIQKLIVRT